MTVAANAKVNARSPKKISALIIILIITAITILSLTIILKKTNKIDKSRMIYRSALSLYSHDLRQNLWLD